jgi:hypothetical protein
VRSAYGFELISYVYTQTRTTYGLRKVMSHFQLLTQT